MLKTNGYVLTNIKDEYKDFVALLQKHFDNLRVFCCKNDFTKDIEANFLKSQCRNSNLLILFVEYSQLANISKFLDKELSPSNYILVCFNSKSYAKVSDLKNVFEFINTCSKDFDMDFFINRLETEKNNKTTISLLQFEVQKFYEIGKSLSSQKDTMKLFEMIIDSSLNLTSSDAGTLYLVVDKENGTWSSIRNNEYDKKLLKFVIAKNQSMDIRLETFTSDITEESIVGYTIVSGKPVRIDDTYSLDPHLGYRHDRSYDAATGYATKSILSIPMKDHENNVMGVIQLINKKTPKAEKLDYRDMASLDNIISYDYADELIMNSLAGQAAIALENSILYRDMQDLLQSYKLQNSHLEFLTRKVLKAHEEERRRIAREIHDGPAQSVVNLSLKVELCKKYLQGESYEKLTGELSGLGNGIRSVSKEIRTIIYNLKPSYLEDGLVNALENHFAVFSDNTGIKVMFSSSGDDRKIEYYMTSTVYRIVQEAFSNINKHAEATVVEVKLNINKKSMVLTISDNGKGFDTSILKERSARRLEGGFGLEGIKERLELIQGDANISSKPGKGTSITIKIPLTCSV